MFNFGSSFSFYSFLKGQIIVKVKNKSRIIISESVLDKGIVAAVDDESTMTSFVVFQFTWEVKKNTY